MCILHRCRKTNLSCVYPRQISPDTTHISSCVQNKFRRCNVPRRPIPFSGNLLLRNSQFTCLQFPTSRNANIPVGPLQFAIRPLQLLENSHGLPQGRLNAAEEICWHLLFQCEQSHYDGKLMSQSPKRCASILPGIMKCRCGLRHFQIIMRALKKTALRISRVEPPLQPKSSQS